MTCAERLSLGFWGWKANQKCRFLDGRCVNQKCRGEVSFEF
jgi:hypothetical protein